MNEKKNKSLYFVLYLIIACIGSLALFYAMKWGPWAFSDSSAYISAARNIAASKGFVIIRSTGIPLAIKEFPPLYPTLLSIFGGKNLDYIDSIRWFNIVLFFSSILIFSKILFSASNNHLLSLIGTLLFISSPQIIQTFTSAMSEPLFLFLLILSFYFCLLLIQEQKRKYKIIFTVISSLLPITRYAGVLFIAIFGFSLLLYSNEFQLIKKLKSLISYFFFSLFPVAIWGFIIYKKYGELGGKSYNLEGSIFSQVFRGILDQFEVIKLWVPYIEIYQKTFQEKLLLGITGTLICIFIYFFIKYVLHKNSLFPKKQKFVFVCSSLMIIGYIFFISFTHSITIPQIDIIDRMMIPIYPLAILFISMFVHSFISINIKPRFFSTILLVLSIIILRFNILISNTYIQNMRSEGIGFTSRNYQQSGIINAVKKLPPDQMMISNSAGFILFYTNRYPIQIDYFPNHTFGSGDSYGETYFRENDAALIILFSDFSNYYNDYEGVFLKKITDTLTAKYSNGEGGIYYYPR